MVDERKQKAEPLKLIACKVIMRARVSGTAKAVGAVLLDHVNWSTFRCDPGIERLVSLTGRSRSNIQSGTSQLEDDGLVIVHVHGGLSGRNGYEFCWDEIRRRDVNFQVALFPGRVPTRNQGVAQPEIGTQTRVKNPILEPGASASVSAPSQRDVRNGQARWKYGRTSTRPTPSARDAHRQSAERTWHNDLLRRFKDDHAIYEAICAAIDETMREAITAAEMQRRGAGLEYILQHLDDLLGPKAEGHG